MSKKKVKPLAKKPCSCKKKKTPYYYKGVAFLMIQSGSEDAPTKKLKDFVIDFECKMNEMRYRPYAGIQMGKPPGGGCVPGSPGCQ